MFMGCTPPSLIFCVYLFSGTGAPVIIGTLSSKKTFYLQSTLKDVGSVRSCPQLRTPLSVVVRVG